MPEHEIVILAEVGRIVDLRYDHPEERLKVGFFLVNVDDVPVFPSIFTLSDLLEYNAMLLQQRSWNLRTVKAQSISTSEACLGFEGAQGRNKGCRENNAEPDKACRLL